MARHRKDGGWIWLDTVNEKRSVGLILFESHGEFGGDPVEPAIVPVGNVTIPPNHAIPSEG